jgi:hypothetical protein
MDADRGRRWVAVASCAVGAVVLIIILVVNVVSHSSDEVVHKATSTKSLTPSAKVTHRRRPKVISEPNSASCIAANVNQMEWGVTPGRPPAVCP